MKGDSIASLDSTTLRSDTIDVSVVMYSLPEKSGMSDSSLFYSCPFQYKDTTSACLMPVIKVVERHFGQQRPDFTITESFLLILLFFVILSLRRLIGKGPEFLILQLKNIFTPDERLAVQSSSFRWFTPFVWLTNLIIVTYAARMYMNQFSESMVSDGESLLFIRIALYIASFWILRQLLIVISGWVFFNSIQIGKWLLGVRLITTLFSLSLLPLVVITESGTQLPDQIFYWWPAIFWLVPKVIQYIQASKLFSIKNGGYFYLILYLCALEILPLTMLIKGLFF